MNNKNFHLIHSFSPTSWVVFIVEFSFSLITARLYLELISFSMHINNFHSLVRLRTQSSMGYYRAAWLYSQGLKNKNKTCVDKKKEKCGSSMELNEEWVCHWHRVVRGSKCFMLMAVTRETTPSPSAISHLSCRNLSNSSCDLRYCDDLFELRGMASSVFDALSDEWKFGWNFAILKLFCSVLLPFNYR